MEEWIIRCQVIYKVIFNLLSVYEYFFRIQIEEVYNKELKRFWNFIIWYYIYVIGFNLHHGLEQKSYID